MAVFHGQRCTAPAAMQGSGRATAASLARRKRTQAWRWRRGNPRSLQAPQGRTREGLHEDLHGALQADVTRQGRAGAQRSARCGLHPLGQWLVGGASSNDIVSSAKGCVACAGTLSCPQLQAGCCSWSARRAVLQSGRCTADATRETKVVC